MMPFLIFLYALASIIGIWVLLFSVADAPEGYEDEEGFHFGVPADGTSLAHIANLSERHPFCFWVI